MDRRQRKTREAIFAAFTDLLSQKEFASITVGEIIEKADIGRATFYAHFETRDFLLKEFCEELFCHIFDADEEEHKDHRHIFACDETDAAFLHLFRHLEKNDNNILNLLASQNNELFLRYFKNGLERLVENQLKVFEERKNPALPDDFWKAHIVSAFVESLKWWIDKGMQVDPETMTDYFFMVV